MGNINKVILIGLVVEKPEGNNTTKDCQVANFKVSTIDVFTNKKGKQERVEMHRIAVFGNKAEKCIRILDKGTKVYIEGRLQYSIKIDENGMEKQFTAVIASTVQKLNSSDMEE
jgi:single-strand DNA-binding protein